MRNARGLFIALLLGLTGTYAAAHASRPVPAAAQPQQDGQVNLPAGTQVLVRMRDSVDSSKNKAGDRFTGSLETNLMVGNTVAAPRGSTVYLRLANATSAGRMSGSSQLTLELTNVVIQGTAYPLLSDTYDVKGQGEGSKTAKKVLGGAGLGALIGGIAGGGAGAAIGAASGGALGTTVAASKKGQQLAIPSETLLEFRLQQPASLPVSR